MKKILKKIIRSSIAKATLAGIGYFYLWFVFKTTRWTYIGLKHPERLIQTNTPFIAAFWHGRLAMLPFLWRWSKPFYMLLSEHEDGRFIAKVISYRNINSIYGSSTRGGAQVALSCIKELKQGHCMGITPDGPKGPRHEVAEGLLHIARLSGAPIVPASYAIQRHCMLNTWDRFLVPLPFSKGIYVIGEPIFVNADKSTIALEESRKIITQALLLTETEANQILKRTYLKKVT